MSKVRLKSGLTFRLAFYSAEVLKTFMLIYVLFMVIMKCSFPQSADRMGNLAQAWWFKNSPNSGRSNPARRPRIVDKIKQIIKSDARYISQ